MRAIRNAEARQREQDVRERRLLAYLAQRQIPTKADLVNLAEVAEALGWSVHEARETAERLDAQWLVKVVNAMEPEPYVFITSEGRNRVMTR